MESKLQRARASLREQEEMIRGLRQAQAEAEAAARDAKKLEAMMQAAPKPKPKKKEPPAPPPTEVELSQTMAHVMQALSSLRVHFEKGCVEILTGDPGQAAVMP